MSGEPEQIGLGSFRYDCVKARLTDRAGNPAALRPQSAEVLEVLAANAGSIVTKDMLVAKVWNDVYVTDDSLIQCIADIRRVIGDTEHSIVQTLPKKGYRLVAKPIADVARPTWRSWALSGAVAATGVLFAALSLWPFVTSPRDDLPPTLAVSVEHNIDRDDLAASVQAELSTILLRYRTIRLQNGASDYRLSTRLIGRDGQFRIAAELREGDSNGMIWAETLDLPTDSVPLHDVVARIAAEVASPLGGAVSERIFEGSRHVPADDLSRQECYAHGFHIGDGITTEEFNRTKTCLTHLIEKDPKDARAMSLLAGIFAHQYLNATALKEPAQSQVALRRPLAARALEFAARAESIQTGQDSEVFLGLAKAYITNCRREVIVGAAERALEANPDDPNLLGSLGNWVAYAGEWDRGVAMVERALAIQPRKYQRWWYYAPAKAHWLRDEYAEALADFQKAYDERVWWSQLQMAYALQALNRGAEARGAVARLRELRPGITRDDVAETYRMWCVDEAFIAKLDGMLSRAGLRSKGEEMVLAK